MGAAVGGEQGKGTSLETTGMKTSAAASYGVKKCQRPTGSKTDDKNPGNLVSCIQLVE